MYDTQAKRAWLEDGATALVQVINGQLQNEWLRKLFDFPRMRFSDFSRRGGDDLMRVLTDSANMGLVLDIEVSKNDNEWGWDAQGQFLGELPKQVLTQWTFQDQVAANFELLAKMRAHQELSYTGIKFYAMSLERLEGWSFRDIVCCRREYKPKMIVLEPSARG